MINVNIRTASKLQVGYTTLGESSSKSKQQAAGILPVWKYSPNGSLHQGGEVSPSNTLVKDLRRQISLEKRGRVILRGFAFNVNWHGAQASDSHLATWY